MSLQTQPVLQDGFENKVLNATDCFRSILDAMAHPARVHSISGVRSAPDGLDPAMTAILLTLADGDTPLWLAPECDTPDIRAYLQFHTGCPILEGATQAAFAVLSTSSSLNVLDSLQRGSDEYPDRSATVLVQCEGLRDNAGPIFSGPGIMETAQFDIDRCPPGLWERIAFNRELFPRGLDWIFTCYENLVALPRTSKLETQ